MDVLVGTFYEWAAEGADELAETVRRLSPPPLRPSRFPWQPIRWGRGQPR